MGNAFYSAEVLQAHPGLERRREEEVPAPLQGGGKADPRRPPASVLAKEKDLELDPRFEPASSAEDFERFRKDKEEFEKASRRRGVRPRDVKRLKESIHRLLARLEPAAADDFDAGSTRRPAASRRKRRRSPKGATPHPSAGRGAGRRPGGPRRTP